MSNNELKRRCAVVDLWGNSTGAVETAAEALALARWLKAFARWKQGLGPKPKDRIGERVAIRCSASTWKE